MADNNNSLKTYVDYLINNKVSAEEGAKLIGGCDKLSREEKNLIYAYTYPRALRDLELPSRVQEQRKKLGLPLGGMLEPNLSEATLIVEAERTEQYGKFIRHLIHAFSDPDKVFPISGTETDNCCICGKMTYGNDLWEDLIKQNPESPEKEKREYLSFGSKESSVTLCADCLIQLIYASSLLEEINPEYLSWWKPSNSTTWKDLEF